MTSFAINTLTECFDLDEESIEALAEIAQDMADEDEVTVEQWIADRGNWTTLACIADDKVDDGVWFRR